MTPRPARRPGRRPARRPAWPLVTAAFAALCAGTTLAACTSPPPLTPEQSRSMHPTPATPAPTPVAPVHLLDQPYVSDGAKAHRLDLTVPGGFRGPRPVVVFVHGGAWSGGDKRSFEQSDYADFQALRARLLEQGWATASIEYRFSDVARMPAQLHDVKAALRWVYAHAGRYGLDRTRIAIMGESAGGHLAQLAGDTRGQAAAEGRLGVLTGAKSDVVAVVSLYGVSDLGHVVTDRVAAGCGEGEAGPSSPEAHLLGGDPADPAMAKTTAAASPITHISATSAPAFFLHGRQDCIVPAAQSERAAAALRAAGVAAKVTLVDAGHADRVFYTTPDLQEQVIGFLRTYLGGPESSPSAPASSAPGTGPATAG